MNMRPVRPIERQRMRPWLENLLNLKCVDGLRWTNKDEKIFEIPWRHGSRHGYSPQKDADLFARWAMHTGRFDKDSPDHKKWKANFRCALNSLDDVKEIIPERNRRETRTVRTYQFVEPDQSRREKRPYNRKKRFPANDSDQDSFDNIVSSSSSTYHDRDNNEIFNDYNSNIFKVKKTKLELGDDVFSSENSVSYPLRSKCTIKEETDDENGNFFTPLPDSTSDQEIKIEREVNVEEAEEIARLEIPLGQDDFEIEIDSGVFQHHLSGFIRIKKSTPVCIPESEIVLIEGFNLDSLAISKTDAIK